MWIHDRPEWPNFTYRLEKLSEQLAYVTEQRGQLTGRLESLGFSEKQEAKLSAISHEVVSSSGIEGEKLDLAEVRSSIAKRLGVPIAVLRRTKDYVEGVVEMSLDAAENFREPLTKERLCGWQSRLFPGGWGSLTSIKVGGWRDEEGGPMQVVSGPLGRETVHFEAPEAARLDYEMQIFLDWFEADSKEHPIVKAGLAHFWFVTIHPFDDGNGRVGRAILDLALARADDRDWRCYSASRQILAERNDYYDALERNQKGSLDVTDWLDWYLGCLGRALLYASGQVEMVIRKSQFWSEHNELTLNERQKKVLNRLLTDFEGKLTNKVWCKLTKTSDASAARDLDELVKAGILTREGQGRGVHYFLIRPES